MRGVILSDRPSRALAWATDAALVVAGTALVAVAAQIAIPFWPVPLTAQTFAVLLVGVALGPLRGTAALGLYLVIGVLGVPAFAEGKSGSLFALTTGGYIIGFVVAARWSAGSRAARGTGRCSACSSRTCPAAP